MEPTWNTSQVEVTERFLFPNVNEIVFPHNGDPVNEKLVSGNNGNGIDECPSEGGRQFPLCRFPFYYKGRYRFECVNRTEERGAECLINDAGGRVSIKFSMHKFHQYAKYLGTFKNVIHTP